MPSAQRPRPDRSRRWEEEEVEGTEYDPDPRPAGRSALVKGLIGFAVVFFGLGGICGAVLLLWNSTGTSVAVSPAGTGLAEAPEEQPRPRPDDVVDRGREKGNDHKPQPPQVERGTLEHVKAATVFIKVETEEYMASGSGFVMKVEGDTVWIVTNDHVVSPPPERRFSFGPNFPRPRFRPPFGPQGPPFGPGGLPRFDGGGQQMKCTAVFHSGTGQEQSYPAEVVGATKDPDLAILRLRGVAQPPQALDLGQGIEVVELMPVMFLGFPFGQALAQEKGNPAVSVGRAAVSSVQRKGNRPSVVNIEGELNPGNSGGPLVDLQGRLVGIVFAKVRDTRIGLAVHAGELDLVLQPRVADGMSVSTLTSNGETTIRVEVNVSDPLNTLPEIHLLYTKDAGPNHGDQQPIPNAKRITMRREGMKAVAILAGEIADLVKGGFTYQFAFKDRNQNTRYTNPSVYHLGAPPRIAENNPPPRIERNPPRQPGRPLPGRGAAEPRTIGKITPPQQIRGLLAHWSFDEGQGEVASDSTDKGHDAKLIDTQWVEGVKGKALQFNGTSSYADMGQSKELNFAAQSEFTFAVWIKTTARGGTFLSLRNSGKGAPVIDVRVENGGWLTAEIRDDATERKRALDLRGAIVNDGQWHHVALVRQADGVCLLYVDGGPPVKHMFPPNHLQAHFSTHGPITTDIRAWGCERYWAQTGRAFGPVFFEGCLDEACIFYRALSPEELKKLAGAE